MRGTLMVLRYADNIVRPHAPHYPDLSPVEHMWDKPKRQMPSCHSVHDLELAAQDLWAHLPQNSIRCLINSMPDRVAACIAAGGGPTRYCTCPVFKSLHALYSFSCLVFEIRVRNQQKSVLSRVWKAFRTTDTAVRKVGGGRLRTTTAGEERYIILQSKGGRRQSASVIAQHLSTATGQQVLRFTVARRFHKGDLFTRRPERCLPLKVDHRRPLLQWCREHKNGSVPEAILNAF
ncbi:transposable element Tcb2 transposase [Trichonephila clavipes]|nr:transposable element Tcb2 transposase [Trichonephila clavipes]